MQFKIIFSNSQKKNCKRQYSHPNHEMSTPDLSTHHSFHKNNMSIVINIPTCFSFEHFLINIWLSISKEGN